MDIEPGKKILPEDKKQECSCKDSGIKEEIIKNLDLEYLKLIIKKYVSEAIKKEIKDMEKRLEKRFEDMEKRFEDMEKRLEKRFEDMEKRFEDMEKRFEDMEKRFEDMEKRFDDMEKRFDDMEDKLSEHERLITLSHIKNSGKNKRIKIFRGYTASNKSGLFDDEEEAATRKF